ncbi:hypothetical protein [Chryseobacterium sp. G0201]|uniref:hypothetical protein n=1 Tax=Chryseobacterium sp. G0201 TaxID=2487065 RepID=UPI000F50A4EA|nr:hypothetical protein [Chryseobacterium sp. G0201]AZA53014.1 hypothetical protein EG348_08320 [Chryseobacterium sp. G0201]
MSKNFLFKALLGLVFGFLVSCDNTTDDPINQNKTTNTNNNGGGATITGPRILNKIISGGTTQQEFISTAGVLEKGIFTDASAPNSFFTGTPTYTGTKISKVKFVGSASNSPGYEFNITYDVNGRISGTTSNMLTGSTIIGNSDYFYTYDSAGKITKIIEKKKIGTVTPTYTHFTENTLTYSGDNITKVVSVMGVTDSSGNPQAGSSLATTFNFTNYDAKINPYTTLPKTFFLMYSLIHPANFYNLSSNNVGNMNFAYPAPTPAISVNLTYQYDTQNYPVSDQTNSINYVYKAL